MSFVIQVLRAPIKFVELISALYNRYPIKKFNNEVFYGMKIIHWVAISYFERMFVGPWILNRIISDLLLQLVQRSGNLFMFWYNCLKMTFTPRSGHLWLSSSLSITHYSLYFLSSVIWEIFYLYQYLHHLIHDDKTSTYLIFRWNENCIEVKRVQVLLKN